MASPRSSSRHTPSTSLGAEVAPLLIGQSLELWRHPLSIATIAREETTLLTAARSQIDKGAQALDVNVGTDGKLSRELLWATVCLTSTFPDVTLLLDCGDMHVLTQALRSITNLDMEQNPSLVANALRPGDGKASMLLAAAAESGAGLVISPTEIDIGARTAQPTTPPPAEALVALFEQAREKAHAAGVNGPLFADTLAYPPAIDATRCNRSLDVLRALAAEPETFVPLVAVGNIGHGAPTPIRPALQRLYAAAALGAGARALILPVEDRALVAAITRLAPPLACGTIHPQVTATHTAELGWLRRVSHAASRGRPLPSPPVTADLPTHAAWALFTNN